MFKKMKLKQRMLLTILGFILITLGGLVAYVGSSSQKSALKAAYELTAASSGLIATKVEKDVATAMDIARNLAESMEAMKTEGKTDRALVNAMLKNIAENHQEFLGVWTLWEPNAFDGEDAKYAGKPNQDSDGRMNIAWSRSGTEVKFNISTGYEKPGTGDYYLLAKNSGEETLLNPYLYNLMGKDMLMSSAVVPIHANGKVVGVVGVDLSMDALQEMVDGFKLYETGFAGVYSNDSRILTSTFKERIGKPYAEVFTGDDTVPAAVAAIKEGKELTITDANGQYKHFTPIGIGASKTPWSVATVVPLKEVTTASTKVLINTSIAGIVVLFIIAGVIYLLTNSIVKPIVACAEMADTMAKGDFTQQMADTYLDRKDEIGILAQSFNTMSMGLRSMIGQVMQSSQNVAAASQEISATTEQIASGSAFQAEAAQTMQVLFSDLSAAIGTVASNAEETSELAVRTNTIAREGGQVVEGSIKSMEEVNKQVTLLERDSNQIGEIIEVIDDIADQTNLLALNAAIEAARAGDQGRGFAVVADEVRKLAERSSEATKQITSIIKGMQENTTNVVKAVDSGVTQSQRTGKAFENIISMIGQTENKVSEIAAACEEQSAQTQEVMNSIQSISAASQEAAAASEETAATSQSLAKLAEELNDSVANFKTTV
ncbi:methyl-accepting chemotaxis protein [Paenibacillus sp. GD4]|uniref:methyl-accepting chemotaxis protein n=1 Tax=Paenibacillus sp. GD4 TaxID=3068890 RepID=UPI0027969940|nr:methyl-accepting chemotaxis protein [Paenibacillus sp. GD4]MDQ1913824.1 methyl-accepting chemotaxis protein [Paenibacillus sp. GD4]